MGMLWGLVMGDFVVSMIKSKSLFVDMARKKLNVK